MNRGDKEHLLEVTVLDDLPRDHMPTTRWMGMRLRIPHELKLHLTPTIIRQQEWKKAKWQAPRDPTGKPLVGLEDIPLGNETFMHAAPTPDELKRHGLKLGEELQTHRETGMADTGGLDGQEVGDGAGIEQRMMGRG